MEDDTQEGILNTLRGIYEAFPLEEIRDLIIDFSENPPWSLDDLFIPPMAPARATLRFSR
jgi:hypothetical protein